MSFEHTIVERPGFNVIYLKGQLIEAHQCERLVDDVENLILKDVNKFVIDLNDLTFINHAGLDILISLLTKARVAGGECIVNNINDELKLSEEYERLSEIFALSTSESKTTELLK